MEDIQIFNEVQPMLQSGLIISEKIGPSTELTLSLNVDTFLK